MKTIIITGSVGTGKTTLAKRLSKKLKYEYIDVNKIIAENRLSSGYDRKRKCRIVDIKKLNRFIIKNFPRKKNFKGIVIDSHLSHYLPKKYIDLCIVTKCSLKALERRLKKRKYPKEKIRENLDCEIFEVCLNEAKEAGHKVAVVNTSR